MKFSRYNSISRNGAHALEIASQFPSSGMFCNVNGDGEIRTQDPLLARQVLSQLSYAPLRVIMLLLVLCSDFLRQFVFSPYGLKWTRTTDLTLIRRAL